MGDILFNYGPGTQYPRVSEKNHTQITWVGAGGEEGAVQRTEIKKKKKRKKVQYASIYRCTQQHYTSDDEKLEKTVHDYIFTAA